MSDRDLLARIDVKLDVLSEAFAQHLGEHKAAAGTNARRMTIASVVAAWCGFGLALATTFWK